MSINDLRCRDRNRSGPQLAGRRNEADLQFTVPLARDKVIRVHPAVPPRSVLVLAWCERLANSPTKHKEGLRLRVDEHLMIISV